MDSLWIIELHNTGLGDLPFNNIPCTTSVADFTGFIETAEEEETKATHVASCTVVHGDMSNMSSA